MVHPPTRRAGATLLVVVALAALAVAPGPAGAQDARAERERVRAQQATLALQVDAIEAEDAEVDGALRDIAENVRGQEALLANAEQASSDATRRAAEAEVEARARQAELDDLRRHMAAIAVETYVNPPGEDFLERMKADSATTAAKKEALLDARARRTSDVVDQLRATQAQLRREQEEAAKAHEEARRQQEEATSRLADLATARAQQHQFAGEVEARLNAKLAEADALARVDAGLAAQIRAEQAALVERLRASAPPPPPPAPGPAPGPDPEPGPGPGPSTPPTTTPSAPPTTQPPPPKVPPPVPLATVRGITVHQRIADQVRGLLERADADGAPLSGWGYRDINEQIALRRQNCGTSDHAVWQMPASQCRPPTAIPGTSMHEQGLAIDFTWNGGGIGTQDHPGYRWLAANAPSFGLYNLPSEPWHWSVNGR